MQPLRRLGPQDKEDLMGLFSGKSGHGHIDRSTGRNRRDNLHRETHGGPERRNGKIVPKGRLAFRRARRTGGR